MSYQFELPRVPGAEIGQALRERAEAWANRTTMTGHEYDAFMEHAEGTAHAAEALISWMGGPYDGADDRLVRCVVTGHANPGHKPREGYSDEHITISIGVLPAESEAVSVEPSMASPEDTRASASI